MTKPRQYHITTFGCQMNKADSERMAGILEEMGYNCTDDPYAADLVLYNTCTIRDNAEQKVYSYLGRQAKRKQEKPDLTLIVAAPAAQGAVGAARAVEVSTGRDIRIGTRRWIGLAVPVGTPAGQGIVARHSA